MPSGRSRVYRVTQLRTDGIHCRESAGTGLVVLKVVPVTGVAFVGRHGAINVRLSFFHTHYRYKVAMLTVQAVQTVYSFTAKRLGLADHSSMLI